MKRSRLKSSAIAMGFAAMGAGMLFPGAAGAQRVADDSDKPLSARQTIPSDALAQAPSDAQPMVARLSVRITQLENEIRRLTGQNEELAHKLRQLTAKLEKVTSDQELRLRALEGGSIPSQATAGTPPEGAAPAGNSPASGAPAVAAVPGADKGARPLGTIREPGASGIAPAQPPTPVPANETPEQLYDRAYALLAKQRDYDGAERVLKTFIEENPNHALAPNAHYWLGRTYFVRGEFESAAFSFAEGFQKFPKSDKAPANLLNLGMSLSRLGKNREACTTYARLLGTYSNAEESIKRRVARERERAKCRQR